MDDVAATESEVQTCLVPLQIFPGMSWTPEAANR